MNIANILRSPRYLDLLPEPEEPRGVFFVTVFHPCAKEPLIRLPCFIRDEGEQAGCPFGLVLDACFILANNSPGFLIGEAGDKIVSSTPEDRSLLLPPGRYHYILNESDPGCVHI